MVLLFVFSWGLEIKYKINHWYKHTFILFVGFLAN